MARYDLHEKAAVLVRDAGGKLVGRTRLQKVAFLTQLAGFPSEFSFEYRHYGPYSEDLAEAMEIAAGLRLVAEEEQKAAWGGRYSIYRTDSPLAQGASSHDQEAFIHAAASVGAIELELAATAAYLYAREGIGRITDGDPWEETRRRKPEKAADGRLAKAKRAYGRLRALQTPMPLPAIL
ncbi:MAG: hypothetical protein RIM84_16420 [Alphaproteobacteria bacterium]